MDFSPVGGSCGGGMCRIPGMEQTQGSDMKSNPASGVSDNDISLFEQIHQQEQIQLFPNEGAGSVNELFSNRFPKS